MDTTEAGSRHVTVQLKDEEGELIGNPSDLPRDVTHAQLEVLANQLFSSVKNDENDSADIDNEPVPCSFYIEPNEASITAQTGRLEIQHDLGSALDRIADSQKLDLGEKVVYIVCQPQAVFRVRPVTRCTSSLPGHGEAITCLAFSPDGNFLASGSGDTTVRFWDVQTETPEFTGKAHRHWILSLAWSPNGRKLASADKNGEIYVWDPLTGQKMGKGLLKGHKSWITSMVFEPLHSNVEARFLASASKDSDIRIWDTVLFSCVRVLAGHKASVTCIRWGGVGLIYSASQDRTIKVWRTKDGVLCRTLEGHGHWVNTMALHTDYVLRTGAYDPSLGDKQPLLAPGSAEEQNAAEVRFKAVHGAGPERLVSGSDDFTLYLWQPEVDKKPIARMTGHQQLINVVLFSPDSRFIASASFDKSVKLWDGRTGQYLASLRSHVQEVYQLAWSADSRLLVSGSKDSTVKLWDMRSKKMAVDLPGHADEVYAVDWSPSGERVASGGKDTVLKIWRK